MALIDTAGDVSPTATVAISAIWNNDFPVFATGQFIVVISLAVAILRHGILPKWLGWVAVVLVVITPDPDRVRRVPGQPAVLRGDQRDAGRAGAPRRGDGAHRGLSSS